jgi:hypothetical protein
MTVEPELGDVVSDQYGFAEAVLAVMAVGAHGQNVFIVAPVLPTQLDLMPP